MTTTRTAARPFARLALVGVALAGITVGTLGTAAHATGPGELQPVDVCLLVPEAGSPGPKPIGPIHVDPTVVDGTGILDQARGSRGDHDHRRSPGRPARRGRRPPGGRPPHLHRLTASDRPRTTTTTPVPTTIIG